MHFVKSALITLTITTLTATTTYAGPYADDLSKCLVESTSTRDRNELVKWMFSAAALHPAVTSIISVSEKQLDEANKSMANLTMKLLTESCKQEATKALKYEGNTAFEASFGVLGEVAGKELFASPEVNGALTGFANYLDEEKLKSLVEKKQ